jgi:ubiquinone/menaquinone biosynthesis C-methylase UbiE
MNSDLSILKPVKRFSNRVENYVRYRPSYPEIIIPFLEQKIGIKRDFQIADIGSGTGLFSELFLKNGYEVIGIEPNEEMRKAAEKKLEHFEGFKTIDSRAEDTGLQSNSVDLITVAQAFHWIEQAAAKKEFLRILKPGGHLVIAYNLRLENTAFLKAYHELKHRYAVGYKERNLENEFALRSFFEPEKMEIESFKNLQELDFEGLKGQLLSASYIPLPGHANYDLMIEELVQLFIKHNENGVVRMQYETRLYFNA